MMEWLLKHNLVRQYLQSNFSEKEYQKAIKYTLIIGIQTLYQLHGSSNTTAAFSLEQLASMIVANNGTLHVQADLPALSQCLKDIKQQLGDLRCGLDERRPNATQTVVKKINNRAHTSATTTTSGTSNNNSVDDQLTAKSKSKSKPKQKSKTGKKCNSKKKIVRSTTQRGRRKADSQWRTGDAHSFDTHKRYPNWWPQDDDRRYYARHTAPPKTSTEAMDKRSETTSPTPTPTPSPTQQQQPQKQKQKQKVRQSYPHRYQEPVAFNIPTSQFQADGDGDGDGDDSKQQRVVQLHVNLYPEYLQKCLHDNQLQGNQAQLMQQQQHVYDDNDEESHKMMKPRSKSLSRCTESSHAKATGKPAQSRFLRAATQRGIAPCLKHNASHSERDRDRDRVRARAQEQMLSDRDTRSRRRRRKSLPQKQHAHNQKRIPRYLQNVESRIRHSLKKDKLRRTRMHEERKTLLSQVARYGLGTHEDEGEDVDVDVSGGGQQWMQEWRDRCAEREDVVVGPSVVSVADAMMQSNVLQAIDNTLQTEPVLYTNAYDHETVSATNTREDSSQDTKSFASTVNVDLNLMSDLRQWAASLSANSHCE
eukprot:CAMPEP_0202687790 /NCGR_PEP_ID=MMETSP1385-20130828/3404_1 /ASSEMBLY_ACC=CAM_ASM_000861 /TAXON_ID=933848 /ORGANISM="Elphidium margaritaceum" /LENGTH=590 /DNA_ID=CAMNT_0049342637 /DNA_START=21 /DNA_END=1793 /DNA_ORIENTATION=+